MTLIDNPTRSKIKKIHFIGIGGSGMSGIAEVLTNLGYEISGSDIQSNQATPCLNRQTTSVFPGKLSMNVLLLLVKQSYEHVQFQKFHELQKWWFGDIGAPWQSVLATSKTSEIGSMGFH